MQVIQVDEALPEAQMIAMYLGTECSGFQELTYFCEGTLILVMFNFMI